MIKSMSLGLALALGLVVVAQAEETKEAAKEALKSGLQPGDRISAYDVVKVAGAPNDEVEEGTKLCYRCKLGNRPVVAVFAHEVDEELVALIKELNALVAKNEKKEMASFVNLLGEDQEALAKEAKKLAKEAKADNVAVVVPEEHKNGPEHLKLNEKADVTVLIYKEGVIEKNHAFAKDELKKEIIAKVLKDTDVILQ
jgi:hypothetical protein